MSCNKFSSVTSLTEMNRYLCGWVSAAHSYRKDGDSFRLKSAVENSIRPAVEHIEFLLADAKPSEELGETLMMAEQFTKHN
jgi:hypothetical protein